MINQLLGEPYLDNQIKRIWTPSYINQHATVYITDSLELQQGGSFIVWDLGRDQVFFTKTQSARKKKVPVSIEEVIEFYNPFSLIVETILLDSMPIKPIRSKDWVNLPKSDRLDILDVSHYQGDLSILFDRWKHYQSNRA